MVSILVGLKAPGEEGQLSQATCDEGHPGEGVRQTKLGPVGLLWPPQSSSGRCGTQRFLGLFSAFPLLFLRAPGAA